MITDFEYLDDLYLVRHREGLDANLFEVSSDYQVKFKIDDEPIIYTVPANTFTDLASIPKVVPKWVAEKLDGALESAVVHDFLCIQQPWTSQIAAEIFLAGMVAAGVGKIKRQYMFRAVLWFGPKW